MKQFLSCVCLFACAAALTGCGNHQRNEVVKETYVHKYGVPVAKSDWETQGKEGKVVQLQKDGITASYQYVNGTLHGETTYTFPNTSTIHYSEQYVNGELSSRRENHPNGMPIREEVYEEGNLVKLTQWYEDGTPSCTETYENGRIVLGEYRTPLNVIESRVVEGDGARICRASNGDLLSTDKVLNGSMVERITYQARGEPATVTPYENGQIHGTRLTFLRGGLPNTVEEWAYGKKNGVTIEYQNGEKIAEVSYFNGSKNGIERRFRDGHLLVEEITWKNDVQHGCHKLFVDDETRVEWYHKGDIVNRATFERMNLPR